MTHFVLGIIVPKEEMNNVEDYIQRVMMPYSENLEVEPYTDKTTKEVEEDFKKFKEDLQEEIKQNKVPDYLKKYVENNKIKKINLNEWAKSWYGGELDKTGNLLSTFNQNSFWDWFRIGGRWDGLLTDNEQSSQNGFNFDSKHETIENNSIKVKELLKKFEEKQKEIKEFRKAGKIIGENITEKGFFGEFGFADIFREFFKVKNLTDKQGKFYGKIIKRIGKQVKDFEFYNPYITHKILINGKLVSQKDYGWFGSSTDTKKLNEYEKEYKKLLEEHKENYMVNLDCHI